MRRSLCTLALVILALTHMVAQTTETPVCDAYQPELKYTLKYKFSYGEDQFYTNIRLIYGSDNVFMAGDKIILKTTEGKGIVFTVNESQLAESPYGYLPFKISNEELNCLQNGIVDITFVRGGKNFIFESTKDQLRNAKKIAQMIPQYAIALKKQIEQMKIIDAEKEIAKERARYKSIEEDDDDSPTFYNRLYVGYSPTTWWSIHYDGVDIGYTGGISLGGNTNNQYIQFGAQFEYYIAPSGMTGGISILIPLDFSVRYNIKDVALSPFVGAIWRINTKHSTSNRMLFQPGFEVGLNVDYKSSYIGILYHMEFFTLAGLGNTRGLAVRLGVNF